jgi:hypothetical protein
VQRTSWRRLDGETCGRAHVALQPCPAAARIVLNADTGGLLHRGLAAGRPGSLPTEAALGIRKRRDV